MRVVPWLLELPARAGIFAGGATVESVRTPFVPALPH